MATFKAVILTGDKFIKSDHTTNVKIRITHRGKQQYVSTKYFVPVSNKKSYWEPGAGKAKNFQDAKTINDSIVGIIHRYIKAESDLGDSSAFMTVAQIKDYLTGQVKKQIDFFEFAEVVIKKLNADGKASTARWHSCNISAMKQFCRHDKLDVIDITADFLKRFENYMYKGDEKIKRAPMTSGGINNYMRAFRSMYNQLRDKYNNELTGQIKVPNYPFRAYKIPQVKRTHQGKGLTVDEMRKIVALKSNDRYIVFARDMFLLLFCLIGINTKDLYFLSPSVNGRVKYDRFKTGKEYSIYLEPEAAAIVGKYRHNTRLINVCDGYNHHRNFMRGLNIHLKKLAAKLEFDIKLATNHARHTWATIARNDCLINKDNVALCLGHEDEDNRITDIYLNYDYTIQDKCNRKVLNLIFKNNERTKPKTGKKINP